MVAITGTSTYGFNSRDLLKRSIHAVLAAITIALAPLASAGQAPGGEQPQTQPTTPPSGGGAANPGTPPPVNAGSTTPAPPTGGTPGQPATDNSGFLTVDLAVPAELQRAPGKYRLRMINRIPGTIYVVDSSLAVDRIAAPLSASVLGRPTPEPTPPGGSPVELTDACKTEIDNQQTLITQATSEAAIALILSAYSWRLSTAGCPEVTTASNLAAMRAITTWEDPEPFPEVKAGDALRIDVSRMPATNPSQRSDLGTWSYQFGSAESQWLVFYGFNYIDSGDENFFSKANVGSNPATYTVTAETDRQNKTFAPSVYFFRRSARQGMSPSRFFTGWRHDDLMGGFTAGLGFDMDNPTGFVGYALGWGDNFLLTSGVAFHKEKRLKGRYQPNEVVLENLESDQLADSTYKPRFYIGLAFRFDSRPTSGNGNSQSQEQQSGNQGQSQ